MERLNGKNLKWLRRIEVDEGIIYDNGDGWAVAFPRVPERPAPATDDRPPMTDGELEAWCVKRCKGMRAGEAEWRRYVMGGDEPDIDFDGVDRWRIDCETEWLPASVAGPALWVAHKWGTP